jgi:3-oxoacid CoA-transferase subunit A
MAGRITIAEVEHLFDPGELDPGEIHLPGVFVQRVVALDPAHAAGKRVERLTTRGQRSLAGAHSGQVGG